MSCSRYESVASRRVVSMKFRRGHIGGVSPFGSHSASFTVSHHGTIIETSPRSSARRRPTSWRRPAVEDEPGKLTTVSFSSFLITRIIGFPREQTAEGKKGWKRAAEIVYFSLAKRRKIKGKQETTACDGNQVGLRPGMERTLRQSSDWLIVVQERGWYQSRLINDLHVRSHVMISVRIFVGFHPTQFSLFGI